VPAEMRTFLDPPPRGAPSSGDGSWCGPGGRWAPARSRPSVRAIGGRALVSVGARRRGCPRRAGGIRFGAWLAWKRRLIGCTRTRCRNSNSTSSTQPFEYCYSSEKRRTEKKKTRRLERKRCPCPVAAGELSIRVSVARRCGAVGSSPAAVAARRRRCLTGGSISDRAAAAGCGATDDPSTRQVEPVMERATQGNGPVSVLRRPRPEAELPPC
jgi:hypothetical protein